MRILLIFTLIVLTSLSLSGCASSSEAVSSGFSGDVSAGPNINLTATSGTLPFGGSTLISAAVRDASGTPVSAALLTQTTFASRLGGKFSDKPVVNNGLVTVTYTAPTSEILLKSDLPINEEITVMYGGAIARVTILLHRLN